MGIHTGVHQAITTNHSDGRARLPPPVLSAAKAVGDAGAVHMQPYCCVASQCCMHL